MFMHNPNVDVENAGFYDFGRTDKSIPIDDTPTDGEKPQTNMNGTPATGTNPRGRYALHFHRTGDSDVNGVQAKAIDDVVWGSPGWGYVNHESNVLMQDNVAFDVRGASFVTELGTELGSFIDNIAIKGVGDGQVHGGDFFLGGREQNFDFGFTGDGFWLQGGTGHQVRERQRRCEHEWLRLHDIRARRTHCGPRPRTDDPPIQSPGSLVRIARREQHRLRSDAVFR